jgi:hypothetical protein
MAVGHGRAVAYVSGHWKASQKIDTNTTVNGGLQTVSCVSAKFCVAGDGHGDAFVYNGKRWSSPTATQVTSFGQISCTSKTFCGAVANTNGAAVLFNGSTWTTPRSIPGSSQPFYISCRPTAFCMALDAAGVGAFRLVNSHWVSSGSLNVSNPPGGSEPNVGSAVSCAGAHFCAALDDFGEAFTWVNGKWSRPVKFDPQLLNSFDAVSCPSKNACVVVDQRGMTTRWNGRAWSTAQRIDSRASLVDVSCTSSRFCVAVDARGRALTYR